jgi:hypothetical protein
MKTIAMGGHSRDSAILGREGWRSGQSEASGSTWADAARMPDLFRGTRMTFSGFVEGIKKLNVAFTAKA